jgi:YD repeat-containing protein
MAKHGHRVVTTGAEIDAAIASAERHPASTAVAAAYDAQDDLVAITFADGVQLRIPRRLIQGLQGASRDQLAHVEIEGPGTGLVWPALDVAH